MASWEGWHLSAYQTEPLDEKTLGQVAYEAYCAYSGWKSLVTGENLPEWHDQSIQVRQAWDMAGQAVADKRDQDW